MKFWQVLILTVVVGLILVILAASSHATTIKVFAWHDSAAGDSARFVAYSVMSGDSVIGATMTESSSGDRHLWTGTANVADTGLLMIAGYVKEGTTPYYFSYMTDISAQKALDTLRLTDDWIAHQSTSDSLWDSLLAVRESLLIVLDSLEALESWVAQQTEVVNIDGWNPITDGDSLIVDRSSLWSAASRTITGTTSGAITSSSFGSGAITSTAIATDAITNAELATSAVDEIWEYDSTLVTGATAMGVVSMRAYNEVLNIDGWNPITDNDSLIIDRTSLLPSLADAVWDEDTTTHYNVGTYGFEATGGASSPWNSTQRDSVLAAIQDGNIANKVWDEDTVSHNTAGSYGILVKDTSAYQGTGGSTDTVAMLALLNNNNFAKNTDSLLLANRAQISGQVSDSVWKKDTTGYLDAGYYGLEATTGGAASVSEANMDTIAAKVWNLAQSGFTTAGTFGYYLDQQISALSVPSGNGAYTINIQTLDTSTAPDSTVTGCFVFMNNLAQSTTPYWDYVDANGVATFQMDAGSWVFFTTEPGYDQNLDTIVVSATATDTLRLNSGTGGRTTIAMQLDKPSGVHYANAIVSVNLIAVNDSLLYVGDSILPAASQQEETYTANSAGLMSTALWANGSISGDSTYYKFIIRDAQRRTIEDKFYVWIPSADTTVWLHNLTTRWR